MFKYLKEYRLADMQDMMRNEKTPHRCSDIPLNGKTAVITGATSGVGLAAAREFARYGCNLIITARNKEKAERVKKELQSGFDCSIEYYLADFESLSGVHETADRISREVEKIDILINSAGIHSTTKRYTAEGLESVFCVNYLASFIITYRLIPKLRKEGPARIIQVNSQGHRFNGFNLNDLNWSKRIYTGLRGYGASKTAQLLAVWEFADRLKGSDVTINAMHPGAVRTNIGTNNGILYNWFLHNIQWHSLKDPRISGEALHYLAADPGLNNTSGKYFNLTHPEKPAPHALDREAGAGLWRRTIELTGLDYEL